MPPGPVPVVPVPAVPPTPPVAVPVPPAPIVALPPPLPLAPPPAVNVEKPVPITVVDAPAIAVPVVPPLPLEKVNSIPSLKIYGRNGSNNKQTVISDFSSYYDTWCHIVITSDYTNNTMCVYVNNNIIFNNNSTIGSFRNDTSLIFMVGKSRVTGGPTGYIDDVRFFTNTLLSQSEVTQLYNAT